MCPTQALVDAQGLSIPLADAGKEAVIDAVVKWVEQAIAEDRKIGALKQLQGHIWRTGFKAGHVSLGHARTHARARADTHSRRCYLAATQVLGCAVS